jgi:hypothetical protein
LQGTYALAKSFRRHDGPATTPSGGSGRRGPHQELPRVAFASQYTRRGTHPGQARGQLQVLGGRWGGAAVPTPEALREQTLAINDRQPLAFLCLLRKPEGGVEVRILHRLMRYYELPGGGAPGFTDKVLGLLGDVRPSQYPVVEVSPTVFHRIGPLGYRGVRVPDVATMLDHLEAAPEGGGLLGPFGADVPNTEVIRPRYIQALPNQYAAMLVHRDGVSPGDAYRELLGMFEADEVLAACSDVLGWLRVACTAKGGRR